MAHSSATHFVGGAVVASVVAVLGRAQQSLASDIACILLALAALLVLRTTADKDSVDPEADHTSRDEGARASQVAMRSQLPSLLNAVAND
ncbi:hypothetical protein ACHHYP_16520 [Achlya hypogyna]|uniref:Uncharacterized protein n=1 Tax=Achlya hypogyna TaxID=1202772 RepID=A0A1V9Y6D6_ACHHY|nr:hypothetical protein ACHHYP_16520 [Achlya hypogyna]